MSEQSTVPIVRLDHIARVYHTGTVSIPAVRDISLEIRPRVFCVIVGPSGSGKTTLLNMIGCIDVPDSGAIEVRGEDVLRLSDNALADFRARHIGYIFQAFNLIPVLSAFENVEYPLLLLNVPAAGTASARGRDAGGGRPGRSGETAAQRTVRRPEAAGGDRSRPGQGAERWCWRMSRPPIWTAPPAPRSSP